MTPQIAGYEQGSVEEGDRDEREDGENEHEMDQQEYEEHVEEFDGHCDAWTSGTVTWRGDEDRGEERMSDHNLTEIISQNWRSAKQKAPRIMLGARKRQGFHIVNVQDHRLGAGGATSMNFASREIFGKGTYNRWTTGIRGKNNSMVGGLGQIIHPSLADRITGEIVDVTGLCRFGGSILRGKGGVMIGVLQIYAPVFGGAVEQKEHGLDAEEGKRRDNRESVWGDLEDAWEPWHIKGASLILTGDFNGLWDLATGRSNGQWSKRDEARHRMIKGMAETFKLRNAYEEFHRKQSPHTFLKSEDREDQRSTIDHILISEDLLHVVRAVWVLEEDHIGDSDHRAIAMSIAMKEALNLKKSDVCERVVQRKPGNSFIKSNHSDEEKMKQYTDALEERWAEANLKEDITTLCQITEEGVRTLGKENVVRKISDVFATAAGALAGAEEDATPKRTTGSGKGKRKGGWSPEMLEKTLALRLIQKLQAMKGAGRNLCALKAFHAETVRKYEVFEAALWQSSVCTFEEWMEGAKETMKILKKELQGRNRKLLRANINHRCAQRELQVSRGKLKSIYDNLLNRIKPRSLEAIEITTAGGSELITDPEEKAKAMTDHFAKWMGRGRGEGGDKWYLKEDGMVNALMADDPEGRRLRTDLAEGTFEAHEVIPEDLREDFKELLECFRYKKKADGTRVSPEDHEGLMDDISETEWDLYWKCKKWGSTPGKTGMSFDQVKMANKEIKEDLRRLANVIIKLKIVPEMLSREVLVAVPKEAGNFDINKLRPLKMQEVLRKAIMGILMRRFMRKCLGMGLIDEIQSGFVPGRDTSLPLLQLRAVMDYCNFYREDLVVVSQDIRHAYDTCEYVSGKEMPLRRWGAPEEFIDLIKVFDENRVTEIRLQEGSSAEIAGEEQGTFHDECGWGQGGEESPMGWACFYDTMLQYIRKCGGKALNITATRDDEDSVEVIGSCFADDTLLMAGGENAREEMQKTNGASEIFQYFSGLEAVPAKYVYAELIWDRTKDSDHGVWKTMEENPGTIHMRYGRQEPIKRSEPTEVFRYLGKHEGILWGSQGTQFEKMQIEVKHFCNLMRYKRVSGKLLQLVINTVLVPRLTYPARFMDYTTEQLKDLYNPVVRLWKSKNGIPSTAPKTVFDSITHITMLDEEVVKQQTEMWLAAINTKGTTLAALLKIDVRRWAHWVGTSSPPMQSQIPKFIGHDGSWISSLYSRLLEEGLGIRGSTGVQLEEGGVNIVETFYEHYASEKASIKTKYGRLHRELSKEERLRRSQEIRNCDKNVSDVSEGCRYHEIYTKHELEQLRAGIRSSAGESSGNHTNHDRIMTSRWDKIMRHMKTAVRTTGIREADSRATRRSSRTGRIPVRFGAMEEEEAESDLDLEEVIGVGEQETNQPSYSRAEIIGEVRWDPHMKEAVLEGELLLMGGQYFVASDGSWLDYRGTAGMGWVFYRELEGGRQKGFQPIAWGWASVGGHPKFMSPYRPESWGILAGMEFTRGLPHVEHIRIYHRLDNLGAVKTAAKAQKFTPREWLKQPDPDVWRGIVQCEDLLPMVYEVGWQRGHPEKHIKVEANYDIHDWASMMVDRLAGKGSMAEMGSKKRIGDPAEWVLTHHREEVTCSMKQYSKLIKAASNFRQYLVQSHGFTEEEATDARVEALIKKLWKHKPRELARMLEAITGWLPTASHLYKRGHSGSEECMLCKQEAETTDHMLFECTHPELCNIRGRWAQEVIRAIKSMWGTEPGVLLSHISNNGRIGEIDTIATSMKTKAAQEWLTGPRSWRVWKGLGVMRWWETKHGVPGGRGAKLEMKMITLHLKYSLQIWKCRSAAIGGRLSGDKGKKVRTDILLQVGELRAKLQLNKDKEEAMLTWTNRKLQKWIVDTRVELTRLRMLKPTQKTKRKQPKTYKTGRKPTTQATKNTQKRKQRQRPRGLPNAGELRMRMRRGDNADVNGIEGGQLTPVATDAPT